MTAFDVLWLRDGHCGSSAEYCTYLGSWSVILYKSIQAAKSADATSLRLQTWSHTRSPHLWSLVNRCATSETTRQGCSTPAAWSPCHQSRENIDGVIINHRYSNRSSLRKDAEWTDATPPPSQSPKPRFWNYIL